MRGAEATLMEKLSYNQKHGPRREWERNPLPFSLPHLQSWLFPPNGSQLARDLGNTHRSKPLVARSEATKDGKWI